MAASRKPNPETLVERIERRTGKRVGIEMRLTEEILARCHPQDDSILFKLPMEIRALIWEFAATQSNDPNHKYEETAYYCRPGHVARHKTYTGFLLSCRRVWLEANALPMQMAEHSFWFQRGPYDQRNDAGWAANLRLENDRYTRLLRSLPVSNLQNLTHIHFFMQMFQAQEFRQLHKMEHFFPHHYLQHGLKPKIFHITIRSSDWWDWEHDAALNLDGLTMKDEGRWVQSILDAAQLGGVQEFRLELETVESKLKQFDDIVGRLQKLEGQPVLVDPTNVDNLQRSKFVCSRPPRRWQWTRSPHLNGESFDPFKDLDELKLHVVVLSWHKKPCSPILRHDETSEPGFKQPESSRANNLALQSSFPTVTATPFRSPTTIMRMRARRAVINEMAWKHTKNFDQYAAVMRDRSDEQAAKTENVRREYFERLIGDMLANDVMNRWRVEGSLLKFVGS